MNDEFLKALRRDPPPQFARRLKQQLQAQDARSQRRSWSLRTRTLLFLIVGSAFAGGMFVLDKHSSEDAEPAQSPAQAQVQTAAAKPGSAAYRPRSLSPGFVPEGNGAPSNGSDNSQQSGGSPANNAFSGQPGQTTQSAASAASSTSEQTASGGLIPSRAAPSIAVSPLADALIRDALGKVKYARPEMPRLETVAADAAFSAFCAPGNARQFDVVVSSRRIGYAEFMNCRDNGVNRIIESKIGYQALVLTNARDMVPLKLSAGDVYLALAKQIPDPADLTRLIPNMYFTWDQVNDKLAYRPISMLGPARETPLRVLFDTMLLEPGCNAQPTIEALRVTEPYRHAVLCRSLREDRLYSEVEQTATLIPQNLWSDPHAFVLVDYGFYLDNQSHLAGSALEGPEPSYATFADGTYPLARPIYLYSDHTRIDRAVDVYDDLQNLQNRQIGSNRYGFVPVRDAEAKGYRWWRQKPPLAASDLTPPRSAPR